MKRGFHVLTHPMALPSTGEEWGVTYRAFFLDGPSRVGVHPSELVEVHSHRIFASWLLLWALCQADFGVQPSGSQIAKN